MKLKGNIKAYKVFGSEKLFYKMNIDDSGRKEIRKI
ncbi:hypothetical protein IMSAGC011_02765 [Lachnospiraceae bacterium]|nr:hypothetical protein IMSAGC011_02765 [Lachnospiraceae bacterium]